MNAVNLTREEYVRLGHPAFPIQIALARLVEDFRVKPGTVARIDIGERYDLEKFYRPVACMWMNEGQAEDISKAEAFAAKEGYVVKVYPPSEDDPLGRARRELQVVADNHGLISALQRLGHDTNGRCHVGELSGPGNAPHRARAEILSALRGVKTAKSNSGVNALRDALFEACGIPEGSLAEREARLAEFCRMLGRAEES